MTTARDAACSTPLPDGRLLVAGGSTASGVTNTVEIYTPGATFTPGPPMSQARTGAACLTLMDGTILVTGGSDGTNTLSSAELFNPTTNSWNAVQSMTAARAGHKATLLPWGAVLITGGEASGTVELYRTNGSFLTVGRLSAPREDYAVATLSNKRVLIIGGTDGQSALGGIDVYNAYDNSIKPGGQLLKARRSFGAATLPDDTVLVTGGYDANGNILKSTEIFNFATGESVAGPDLPVARAEHQSYTLPNNSAILLAGGTDGTNTLNSTEMYAYWSGTFLPGTAMHGPRKGGSAAMLRDGALVVVGGQRGGTFLPGSESYRFATVSTDKTDYHPGDAATVTGFGWQPGEQVQITVTTLPADQHKTEFTVVAIADANGQISSGGFNIDQGHLNRRFLLTATGGQSVAQTTFIDGATNTSITGISTSQSAESNSLEQVEIKTSVTGAHSGQAVKVVIDGMALPDAQLLAGTSTSLNTFTEIPGGGIHTIEAVTVPDAMSAGSNSEIHTFKAHALTTSTVNLNVANLGAAFNTSQPITVIVAPSGPPTPTGTITFTDTSNGNAALGTVTLNSSGAAVFDCAELLPIFGSPLQNVHTIQAAYSGDGNYSPSSNTASCQTSKIAPTFNVTSSIPNPTAGQGFNVTVAGQAVVGILSNTNYFPSSGVALTNGFIGTQALAGGSTTFTNVYLPFSAGSLHINVTSSVDPIFSNTSVWPGIAFASIPQTVPTVTVTTSPTTPATVGSAVTYQAVVSPPADNNLKPSTVAPAGVVFTDGTNTSATILLDATGKASYTPPTVNTPVTRTVTASWAGDNDFTAAQGTTNLTINPGAATHLTVSAPTSVTAGVASNVTVTAFDQFNNTAAGYSGIVHFTSTDAAAVLPSNATLTNSVGTFAATLKSTGAQTVTATDSGTVSIAGTSNTIAVAAGPATHFAVAVPANGSAGTGFNVTVTALDQFNNTATGYNGTVHFTSTDGAAALSVNSTLTNGVGAFVTTMKTVGAQTVTATDTVTAAITGTSSAITIVCGLTTHFSVTAAGNATAGTAFNLTVTALDLYNNTSAGYSGTVQIGSTDSAAALPANSALTNGVGVFAMTLKTAGARTITATDASNGAISGNSGAITVAAAATSRLVVAAPSSAMVGTGFNYSVTALDAFGNTASGYAGTVRLSTSDASASFTAASSTLTSGTGTFGITMRTAGSQTITASDTVNAAIAGTSSPIQVSSPVSVNGTVSTSSLTFQYYLGMNAASLAQTVWTGSASPATYTVSSPVAWLVIANGFGNAGSSFVVTPNPTGLSTGRYQTTLVVNFSGGASVSIAVQLQVGAIQLYSTPGSLSFSTQTGSTTAQTGSVAIQAMGINVAGTVSVSGGSWLTATANGPNTPFSIQAKADPTGLAAGTYSANILVASTLATNSPLSIPVTLVITSGTITPPPPAISVAAIVNGASMQAGSAAPNTIVSAFGTFPGCTSGAQVTVDGNSTNVFASTATQINFLVPANIAAENSAQVVIACAGLTSQTIALPIASLSPSIFTASQSGTGQAAIVNQDGSVDTASTAGTYIQVYGTGFGVFTAVGGDKLAHLAQAVTATVGNIPASVLYAGEAPGYTSGLQQIDVLIPAGAPKGPSVPLVLIVGGTTTQAAVTIGVQ